MIISKLSELIEILEKRFPLSKAEEWDFSGYSIVGDESFVIEKIKIMIALDPTEKAINYAIKHNYDILITHHPFIFASSIEEYVLKYPSLALLIEKAKKSGVSFYSLHTNYDNDSKGTAYEIFKHIKFKKAKIKSSINSSIVIELNEELKIKQIAKKFKKAFLFPTILTTAAKNKNISSIFLSPGAGDVNEVIEYNEKNPIDLYITSDLKWNEKVLLLDKKIDFLEIPHKVEEVFIESLYNYLTKECQIQNKIFKFNTRSRIWGV